MKTNKKKRKSLVKICLVYFLVYSIILTIIFVILNIVVNRRLDKSFPNIDDIINKEELFDEDFENLKNIKCHNCDFIIYDENDLEIYTTNKKLSKEIESIDLGYITDYYGDYYYSIFKKYNEQNELYYLIVKSKYDAETNFDEIIATGIIDENYKVIEGDLFAENTTLSEKQFKLLQDSIDNKIIEKYEYITNTGKKRTLVFTTNEISDSKYYENIIKANLLWLLSIPFILTIIIIESVLFAKKIKKCINPLNDAITDYKNNSEEQIPTEEIPSEFTFVYSNFQELVDNLDKTQKEKENMYQSNRRIIADISHDLKNPLTIVEGYSKALVDKVIPDDKKDKYIKAIYNRSIDMEELIKSLTEYTQIEHPDYIAEKEPCDLTEFTREYLANKYQEINELGFKLVNDLPEKECKCLIDKKLIKRLYDNLIGNSLKYNKKGTTIYFKINIKKEKIIITIADNGIGIDSTMAEKIFNPFVSGNEARTPGTGTGLGLSISKKIVELHNGQIELIMPPSKGYKTEFEITLKKS